LGWQVAGILVSGAMTVAAFMVKGPPGLYPLAFPFIWGLVHGWNWKSTFWAIFSLGVLVTMALIYLIFFSPGKEFFAQYFEVQLGAALSGTSRENLAPHRFYMLQRFLETHLVWMVAVFLLIGIRSRWKWATFRFRPKKAFWLVLLVGLSAMLPIMVSTKQAAHYLTPSAPWFAMALAILAASAMEDWARRPIPRVVTAFLTATMASTGIWVGSHWGQVYPSYRPRLNGVRAIMEQVPVNTVIGMREEEPDYQTEAYFQRYYQVDLNRLDQKREYYLWDGKAKIEPELQANLEEIKVLTGKYKLYRKKNVAKNI
jgi:hypothetical protein